MESTHIAYLAISVTVALLCLYFGLLVRLRFLKRIDQRDSLLFTKFAGFAIFGIIPFAIFNQLIGLTPSETGLTAGKLSANLLPALSVATLVVLSSVCVLIFQAVIYCLLLSMVL